LADLRIGTSGWAYDFWVGGFYPTFTKSADYLKTYSNIFKIVEIDSSFYRIPSKETIKQWAEETPDDFLFTAKFRKTITADKRLTEVKQDVQYLLNSFEPMGKKLAAFVIQLPPNFIYEEGIQKLGMLIPDLDPKYRYAVEFRDVTWFRKETYDLLRAGNIALAWSEIPYARNTGVVTTDFIYLRFIGERNLPQKQLGEVLRDIVEKKRNWSEKLKEELPRVKKAFVFFNNQFEGFGPGSVNSFRRLVGLEQIDFKKINLGGQQTLFDFGSHEK